MFRIIVASDSHGSKDKIEVLLKKYRDSANSFFHLGDNARDVSDAESEFPGVEFISVLGNCDYFETDPAEYLYEYGKLRFFLTHGHKYGVKYGLNKIIAAAHKKKANICLFGHTHATFLKKYDGIYFMNPGSLAFPRDGRPPCYGVVDIGEEIKLSIYSIEKSPEKTSKNKLASKLINFTNINLLED
jgi:putative phosphoesterase